MEDIFYFSKAYIRPEEIATLAEECGYMGKYYTYSVRYLNVYYEHQGFWQWSELKENQGDFDDFDYPQQEKIAFFQPVSAFMISYRATSLPKLLLFLKRILGSYGGWVGCDDGNFKATYDFENIENLCYPHPDEDL